MIPAQYFPLTEPIYSLKIGASPLVVGGAIFERDECFDDEMRQKRESIAHDRRYYCQEHPGSEIAQREVAAMIGVEGGIFEAGNAVQEDLLILDARQPGLPLVAGHLCFANAWCLDDKMGKPFLEIHGPVPGFATTIGPSSEKLLERLKPGRPVARLNWAVKASGQLDLTSRWDEQVRVWNRDVDESNAGSRCWMRAERQTLSALEHSGCVLFTVHTYTQPVKTLTIEQRRILFGVLQTCPEEMLRYKGIWPFHGPLLTWLSQHT